MKQINELLFCRTNYSLPEEPAYHHQRGNLSLKWSGDAKATGEILQGVSHSQEKDKIVKGCNHAPSHTTELVLAFRYNLRGFHNSILNIKYLLIFLQYSADKQMFNRTACLRKLYRFIDQFYKTVLNFPISSNTNHLIYIIGLKEEKPATSI